MQKILLDDVLFVNLIFCDPVNDGGADGSNNQNAQIDEPAHRCLVLFKASPGFVPKRTLFLYRNGFIYIAILFHDDQFPFLYIDLMRGSTKA